LAKIIMELLKYFNVEIFKDLIAILIYKYKADECVAKF